MLQNTLIAISKNLGQVNAQENLPWTKQMRSQVEIVAQTLYLLKLLLHQGTSNCVNIIFKVRRKQHVASLPILILKQEPDSVLIWR